MLDYNAQKIKLTNFTSSVFLSEQLIDDIGDVKLSLPVDVVPPEVRFYFKSLDFFLYNLINFSEHVLYLLSM